jgi:hypothetical protein
MRSYQVVTIHHPLQNVGAALQPSLPLCERGTEIEKCSGRDVTPHCEKMIGSARVTSREAPPTISSSNCLQEATEN